MNRIDNSSVIKSGAIAAGAALLLGLIGFVVAYIPVLNCLVFPLICLGWFLIPFGAGMGYGYLAPGKETLNESALGGALAGGVAGLIYGILSGIATATVGGSATAVMEQADVAVNFGGGELLISLCCPALLGFALGALGGVAWPMFQRT